MTGKQQHTPPYGGVYVSQALTVVEELIASLRLELATLEAMHTLMQRGTDPADAPHPSGDERASATDGPIESEAEEGAATDHSRDPESSDGSQSADGTQDPGSSRTMGPPRSGSMRDGILTLLGASDEPMSATDIAFAIRPGADPHARASVKKTLDRMRKMGEIDSTDPGLYKISLSPRAA
jgi:hypothetical protein